MSQALEQNTLAVPQSRSLPNCTINLPCTLVGDEGFPLKSYIMRPYSRRNLKSNERKVFNYRLSRARRVVENAFGILAARWQILQTAIGIKIESAEKIIQAVVCLHNYIISTNSNQYMQEHSLDQEDPD